MSKQPSNQKLSEDLELIKEEVRSMNHNYQAFQQTVQSKLAELHDFMIVQVDRQTGLRNGNGKLNWNKIILATLAFLGTLGTVLLIMAQTIQQVSK